MKIKMTDQEAWRIIGGLLEKPDLKPEARIALAHAMLALEHREQSDAAIRSCLRILLSLAPYFSDTPSLSTAIREYSEQLEMFLPTSGE